MKIRLALPAYELSIHLSGVCSRKAVTFFISLGTLLVVLRTYRAMCAR